MRCFTNKRLAAVTSPLAFAWAAAAGEIASVAAPISLRIWSYSKPLSWVAVPTQAPSLFAQHFVVLIGPTHTYTSSHGVAASGRTMRLFSRVILPISIAIVAFSGLTA